MGLFKPNIKKLNDNNDIPALLKCLTHRKAEVRLNAFLALLDKYKDDKFKDLDNLKVLKDDPDVKVRAVAVLKLAKLTNIDVFEQVRFIVINGAQHEKIEALRILADLHNTRNVDISNITVVALNDKNPMVQIEAMRTMGAIKDKLAVIHLIDKLEDKKYTIRLEAVKALGKIGIDEVVDHLVGSLTDKNGEVRKVAREALKSIGTERAIELLNNAHLMLLIKRMNDSVAERENVIKHIGKNKIIEGLPLIRKACSDEYKSIRIEAVKSIGLIRDKSSIGLITKMIDDPYYDVRLEAVKTLEKFIDETSLLTLEKAMKDFNKNVRDEAKRAYFSVKARLENKNKDKDK